MKNKSLFLRFAVLILSIGMVIGFVAYRAAAAERMRAEAERARAEAERLRLEAERARVDAEQAAALEAAAAAAALEGAASREYFGGSKSAAPLRPSDVQSSPPSSPLPVPAK